MADFARMQGLTADAQHFTDEAALTKDAFNKKFLTVKRGTTTVPGHILYPDSTFYGNNTVTANLLPLTFGMIDDDYVKQEVQKNIIKNIITDNGGHVSCGVIGISWLMHGLTDMGRSDVSWPPTRAILRGAIWQRKVPPPLGNSGTATQLRQR